MALAIYCDHLIRTGVVESQTDLASFGHISTARMTQIMALLNLAPDIQEELLFLPLTRHGHDAIKESDVNLLVDTFDWQVQRRRWAQVRSRANHLHSESSPEGTLHRGPRQSNG